MSQKPRDHDNTNREKVERTRRQALQHDTDPENNLKIPQRTASTLIHQKFVEKLQKAARKED